MSPQLWSSLRAFVAYSGDSWFIHNLIEKLGSPHTFNAETPVGNAYGSHHALTKAACTLPFTVIPAYCLLVYTPQTEERSGNVGRPALTCGGTDQAGVWSEGLWDVRPDLRETIEFMNWAPESPIPTAESRAGRNR